MSTSGNKTKVRAHRADTHVLRVGHAEGEHRVWLPRMTATDEDAPDIGAGRSVSTSVTVYLPSLRSIYEAGSQRRMNVRTMSSNFSLRDKIRPLHLYDRPTALADILHLFQSRTHPQLKDD